LINEDNDMKVLVTGASGFIGNYIVEGYFDWIEKVAYIQTDLNEDNKD